MYDYNARCRKARNTVPCPHCRVLAMSPCRRVTNTFTGSLGDSLEHEVHDARLLVLEGYEQGFRAAEVDMQAKIEVCLQPILELCQRQLLPTNWMDEADETGSPASLDEGQSTLML